jgi:hypothetical protein
MHAHFAFSLTANTAYSSATALAELPHLQASASIFFTVYADAGDPA